jgi:putative DNA topoisomerase
MKSENDNPFSPVKQAEECPKCQSELVIKSSAKGPFWGCSSYPDCDYSRPLSKSVEMHVVKVLDDVCCPECEGDLAVKSGKFGMFIGCMNYPDCHFIVKEEDDEDYTPVSCPKCEAGELHMRASKKGNSFYACNQYPDCNYLVNDKPLAQSCPKCEWPILTQTHPDTVSCPECHYTKQTLIEE